MVENIKIVRRFSKKLHKYYYIQKGTGKRKSRTSWENYKQQEKRELNSEVRTKDLVDNIETLSLFTQSLSSIIRDIIYIYNKSVYFVRDGIRKFNSDNGHLLLLEIAQYISDHFKNIKKDASYPDLFSFIVKKGNKIYICLNTDEYENFTNTDFQPEETENLNSLKNVKRKKSK